MSGTTPQIFGVFGRPSVPPEVVINVQIRSTHVYGLQVKYTMRTKRLEVPQTAQRLHMHGQRWGFLSVSLGRT